MWLNHCQSKPTLGDMQLVLKCSFFIDARAVVCASPVLLCCKCVSPIGNLASMWTPAPPTPRISWLPHSIASLSTLHQLFFYFSFFFFYLLPFFFFLSFSPSSFVFSFPSKINCLPHSAWFFDLVPVALVDSFLLVRLTHLSFFSFSSSPSSSSSSSSFSFPFFYIFGGSLVAAMPSVCLLLRVRPPGLQLHKCCLTIPSPHCR